MPNLIQLLGGIDLFFGIFGLVALAVSPYVRSSGLFERTLILAMSLAFALSGAILWMS